MSLPVGQPSAVAYMSIAQSKRWNRQPIKTASDHDDHVGGGVSLTAVSDFDDSTPVPSCSRISNSKDEKPVTRSSSLNANATPFKPTMQVGVSSRSTSSETSTTSSASAVSSATQPNTVQPAAPKEETGAASVLMNLYLDNQQRTRAATTSAHEQGTMDDGRGYNGYGSSTARSSPIKKEVTLGHAAIAETETDMSGAAQQDIGETKQHINGNTPLRRQPQITHPATPTTNGVAHRQNIQTGPRITPTVSHETRTLPLMGDQMAAGNAVPIAPTRAVNAQTPNGIHYNTNVPTFTPPFGVNGNPIAANTMQIMSTPSNVGYRLHPAHNFVNGTAYGQQSQMQGHADGNHGYTYNQPHPPPPPRPAGYFSQEQVGENSMSYSNQLYQKRINHEQWKHSNIGNGAPVMPANGESSQPSSTQNTPPGLVRRYQYGLPGSASDGSMSQYNNGQSYVSAAIVQLDHEPIQNQPTVGPLDFEVPSKETLANRSEMLQALTENGRPSSDDLFDPKFLPFIAGYKYSYPPGENGVIVIRNIPYETTRGEIIALLGKTSKILNDREEPIHIIMDRVTSKTQDAFCELSSLNAAIEMVQRFKAVTESGRVPRLGNRVVEVELSSQTSLMSTLFPSSKYGVKWRGAHAQIVAGSQFPWDNFSGFFTEEEMVMLSKHVENPQRSQFSKICPERPYECMISTLRKIPWYMAEYITIKQRHSVYESCMKMINVLVNKLNSPDQGRNGLTRGGEDNAEPKRLTPQLLDRLVASAMLCPGFSVVQKHNIATTVDLPEHKSREFNQPRFPDSWRHQWTLVPKVDMPIDVLEWYISVIRTETNRVVQSLDIYQRMPLQGMMEGLDGYWGFFWAEANFPTGRAWDKMSLAECSRLEWQAIERIINRAIQGGTIPLSYTSGSYHINSAPTNGPARLTYRGH